MSVASDSPALPRSVPAPAASEPAHPAPGAASNHGNGQASQSGNGNGNGNGNGVAAAPWTRADAEDTYHIDRWGQGYFAINDLGNVAVHPTQDPARSIDLKQLVDDLRERDLGLPLLIRFTDLLKHRVGEIHGVFANAIKEYDYAGRYACVYPIKVNQQRHVVEEIIGFGTPFGFGVEAGSKPELLAAMAMVTDDNTPIICNGFKDDEFIEAVILATKLGKFIIPVVEKASELDLIIRNARKHDVRPRIGVRVKLAAKGAGRWEQSGGDRSKFGLYVSEVLDALHVLKRHDMADCFQLLHFHLGSQITEIRRLKQAVTELARVYVELLSAGAGLKYIDVGGGLGVDYDGSKSSKESSINYSLQEYANNVVHHIKEVCDSVNAPHPNIISESGRALVAHHSVLVFNVVGWNGTERFTLASSPGLLDDREGWPQSVVELHEIHKDINENNVVEFYHDAMAARDQTLNMFNLGYCTIQHRALAERLFYAICAKVLRIIRHLDEVPEELSGLEAVMAETYFCNFSVFQSCPDSWAINQLFPIMPIHRLLEQPTSRGILADITCDSDGKIDNFIGARGPRHVLELHPFDPDKGEYHIAVFLVGAYQEILGDLHNLLGDTNAVHVSLSPDGQAQIDEVIEGDTVREVLNYVQISAQELRRAMRQRVELAVRDRKITVAQARLLLSFYYSSLDGYTYLE